MFGGVIRKVHSLIANRNRPYDIINFSFDSLLAFAELKKIYLEKRKAYAKSLKGLNQQAYQAKIHLYVMQIQKEAERYLKAGFPNTDPKLRQGRFSRIFQDKNDLAKKLIDMDSFAKKNQDVSMHFSYAALLSAVYNLLHQAADCNYKPKKSFNLFQKHLCKEFGNLSLEELINARADNEWGIVLENLFSLPNVDDYFEAVEGHNVWRLPFEHGALILKGGNENSLEKERQLILTLKDKIEDDFFETTIPLEIKMHKGRPYLPEPVIHGMSLADAFHQSKDYYLFRQASRFLSFVHAVMPWQGKLPEFYPYFESYLKKFDLPNNIKQAILENIAVFLNPFYGSKTVFDRDAQPHNWFISADIITLLDLADRGVTPAEHDTTKLFNRGDFFELNAEGSKLKEQILIEDYLAPYNVQVSDDRKRDELEFVFNSLHATPCKALVFFFNSLNIPRYKKEALAFIDNAVQDIGCLKEPRFSKMHSLAEMKQCEAIQKILVELKTSNYHIRQL